MSTETKRRIRFFGVHTEAHLDELEMADIVREHGQNQLYWPEDEPPTLRVFRNDDEILKCAVNDEDIMFLGCAGKIADKVRGIVIDEHGGSEGREQNVSGTLLAARYCGVDQLSEYDTIIREVTRSDTVSDQRKLELGQLVKTLYGWGRDTNEVRVGHLVHMVVSALRREARGDAPLRSQTPVLAIELGEAPCIEDSIRKVTRIVFPAYSSLTVLFEVFMAHSCARDDCEIRVASSQPDVDRYAGRRDVLFIGIEGGQIPPEMNVKKVAERLHMARRHGIGRVLSELKRYKSEKQGIFELGRIVDTLNVYGEYKPLEVLERVAWILSAVGRRYYERHVLCPKEFTENDGWTRDEGELKIAFIDSKLRTMSSFCFGDLKAKVVVIRNLEKGQTCIFTARDNAAVIVSVMVEVLKAEAKHAGIAADSLERKLGRFAKMAAEKRDGYSPGYEHWYVMFKGGTALNGSLTHDSPATAISAQAFVYAVVNGVRIHQGLSPYEVP